MNLRTRFTLLCTALALAACATRAPAPTAPARPPVSSKPTPLPSASRPAGPVVKAPVPASDADAKYIPVTWAALPGWREANLAEGFSGLLESCKALVHARQAAISHALRPRANVSLSPQAARKLAAAVLRAEGRERLPAYCVAIAQAALKYAEREERRAARRAAAPR